MEEMYMNEQRESVYEVRKGDVRATVWFSPEDGRRGRYSVTIHRVYSKAYQLHYANTYRYDDLMNVLKVARRAHFWIWWQGGAPAPKRRRK